ncbi:MAG: hypothetical protein ABI298_06300 [Acidimicrobiales bacterium]
MRLLVTLIVVAAIVVFVVGERVVTRATASNEAAATGFYLAMGGSSSLGFQPTGIPSHNGKRTTTGYANDIVNDEVAKGLTLTLRQVGCPGETLITISGADDACYAKPAGQMTASINYLTMNPNEIGLVTIDLGFNDVRACLLHSTVNLNCANQGITTVRRNLPAVLRRLKSEAGPNVHFVGLLYEDPFLADYLAKGSGITEANLTLRVMAELNATLQAAYVQAHIPMANVPGAFRTANTDPVPLANVGTVPQNVERACTLTWMCSAPPWGPDDHPNNAGYRAIATAIEGAFPKSW